MFKGGKQRKMPRIGVATMAAAGDASLAASHAGAPILQICDLRTNLLKRASLSLSAGECIAVQGPSGAGKTLLLRAIADLDPNQGVVRLGGRDRSAIAGPEWRRLVGYVPAPSPAGGRIRWARTSANGRLHFPSSETSDFPRRRRLGRSPG